MYNTIDVSSLSYRELSKVIARLKQRPDLYQLPPKGTLDHPVAYDKLDLKILRLLHRGHLSLCPEDCPQGRLSHPLAGTGLLSVHINDLTHQNHPPSTPIPSDGKVVLG